MMMQKLIDIRCPFKYTSKRDGKIYTCNHLCFKVYPGSSGQAWCSKCQLAFEFEVNNQEKLETSIKVKKNDRN